MRMKVIRRKNTDGSVSLRLVGEFTIYTVRKLKDLIKKEIDGASRLNLDLACVTSFDSAGFQLLEYASLEAVKRNRTLVLGDKGAEVSRLYTLFGKNL
jgi:anti-anti-sigma factor